MIDLQKKYLLGATFISYNEELKGCILLESKDGIIPLELKVSDLQFLTSYPNIMIQLKKGKKLFVKAHQVYLGEEKKEGPYSEQATFISQYYSKNPDFNELIVSLENDIKNEKINVKKLINIVCI